MIPFFSRMFPGTNLQDLNLDWIVRRIMELSRGIIAPWINAQNQHWMVYDTAAETFVDSGVSAAGEGTGPQGEPGKSPVIGTNGHWYTWDVETGAYTDTGIDAQGPEGPTGPIGPAGPQGVPGPGVNPNLLDNWYFVGGGSASGETFPINQRGQSSYTLSGGAYGFDRWKSGNNAVQVELGADGLTLTSGSAVGSLQQVLSVPFSLLAGKKLTYSILFDGGFATGSGTVPTSSATDVAIITLNASIPNGNYCSFRLAGGVLVAGFGQNAGNALKVKAVKLEIGDTQTLAHQENGAWVLNEIPAPAVEMAKCRRYYQRLAQAGAGIGYVIANVIAYSASSANLTLRLDMRVPSDNALTVTCSDISDIKFATQQIWQGISATSITAAKISNSGDVIMNLNAVDASTSSGLLTAGTVYNAALGSGWLAFSTEP